LLFKYAFAASLNVWQVLLISVFAAALELISARGLDNITITLGSAFLAYSLIYLDGTVNYLAPIILTPIVIAVVLSKRVLTPVFSVAKSHSSRIGFISRLCMHKNLCEKPWSVIPTAVSPFSDAETALS
jgi:hypothetical protein